MNEMWLLAWRGLRLAIISFFSAGALVTISLDAGVAQDHLAPPADTEARIADIAKRIAASSRGPNAVDFALREVGFPPANLNGEYMRGTAFQQLPDARKLAAAFHSANAGRPGAGEQLLREVMVLVSQKNIALTADPAFRSFVSEDPAFSDVSSDEAAMRRRVFDFQHSTFSFGQLAPGTMDGPLPPQAREIIDAVVRHSPRTPGGVIRLARACCGLPDHAVFDRMYRAASTEEIIEWAIRHGTLPPEFEKRLAELVRYAQSRNIALTADAVITNLRGTQKEVANGIDPFADAIRRHIPGSRAVAQSADIAANVALQIGGSSLPDVVAGLTGGTNSRGERRAQAVAPRNGAAGAFASFQAREYGVFPNGDAVSGGHAIPTSGQKPNGLGFRAARRSARGFGGVILGNDVTAEGFTSAPMWFEWIEAGAGKGGTAYGAFRVFFGDGSLAISQTVPVSYAHSALKIVFDGVSGATAALNTKSGEAVGLAGYTGRAHYHYLDKGRVQRASDAAHTFVVHPALIGLGLAEDAVLVDAIPFNLPTVLETAFSKHANERAESTWLMQSFLNWLNDDNRSTYKFIDVPLIIDRNQEGVLRLRRQALPSDKPEWDDDLRQSSFITFQKFDLQGNPTAEEDPPFYHLVPHLAEAWPSFRRLNQFAGLLAVVRWLKSQGAVPMGEIMAPAEETVLTTLVKLPDGEVRLERMPYEIDRDLAHDVRDKGSSFVASRGEAARTIEEEIHSARLRRLDIREALLRYDLDLLTQGLEYRDDLMQNWSRHKTLQDAVRLSEKPQSIEAQIFFRPHGLEPTSMTTADRLELRDLSRNAALVWENMRRRFLGSDAGQFLLRLEEAEALATDSSPLAKGMISVKGRIIGDKIAPSLSEYVRIKGEAEALRSTLATVIATKKKLEERTYDDTFLLNNIADAKERILVQDYRAEAEQLQATIDNPEAGLLQRWRARWSLRRTSRNLKNLMQTLTSSGHDKFRRLQSEIEDNLRREIQAAQERAQQEYNRKINLYPLDGFQDWWELQVSYRDTVFGDSLYKLHQ